ncbi:hypothetical protein [Yersinia intermedia]|uniref:hypothetical protein n=1 Tax=Yersinia intermedia TaxID=631 RepID=UPI0012D43257|nr:hypothetical protein [Yersinia intermedia]
MKIEGVCTLSIDIYHKYLLCANKEWSEEQVHIVRGMGWLAMFYLGFMDLVGRAEKR